MNGAETIRTNQSDKTWWKTPADNAKARVWHAVHKTIQEPKQEKVLQLKDTQRIKQYLTEKNYKGIIDVVYTSKDPEKAKEECREICTAAAISMCIIFNTEWFLTNEHFDAVLDGIASAVRLQKQLRSTVILVAMYRALAYGIVRHATLKPIRTLAILKELSPWTDFTQLQKFVEEV